MNCTEKAATISTPPYCIILMGADIERTSAENRAALIQCPRCTSPGGRAVWNTGEQPGGRTAGRVVGRGRSYGVEITTL